MIQAGRAPSNLPGMALAGLLVGAGTVLGSGRTSGHGVCGLSRLSGRSLVAVLARADAARAGHARVPALDARRDGADGAVGRTGPS